MSDVGLPEMKYWAATAIRSFSKRYGKSTTVPKNFPSDGATGARDIGKGDVSKSKSWWVHDRLCALPIFDDGTFCTAAMASFIIYDILREEGRWIRAPFWWLATLVNTSMSWSVPFTLNPQKVDQKLQEYMAANPPPEEVYGV